jgi:hypothetical protein
MLCQICGKSPATLHFTEIHDNKMSELHVCERCAEEKGLQSQQGKQKFDIADVILNMKDGMTQSEEERVGAVQCPAMRTLPRSARWAGRCADATGLLFQRSASLQADPGDTRPGACREGASRSRQVQRLADELQRVDREGVRARGGDPGRDQTTRVGSIARPQPSPRRKEGRAAWSPKTFDD